MLFFFATAFVFAPAHAASSEEDAKVFCKALKQYSLDFYKNRQDGMSLNEITDVLTDELNEIGKSNLIEFYVEIAKIAYQLPIEGKLEDL